MNLAHGTVSRRALSRRALAVSAVLLLLAACATEEFVDRATLLRDPAAKLRFPEAVELGHVGGERENTFEGAQGAFPPDSLGRKRARPVHARAARAGGDRDL